MTENLQDTSGGGDSPLSEAGSPLSGFERSYLRYTMHIVVLQWVTVVILVVSAIAVWQQIGVNTETLKKSNYIAVANWTFEVDKIYLEHKDLMPYIYEGKQLLPNDPNSHKLNGVLEIMMDNMDSMLATYDGKMPDQGWRNWSYAVFWNSPLFRSELERKRAWYCRNLYPYYLDWAKRAKVSATFERRCA